MKRGELAHLAVHDAEIAVRVTPKAGRNAVALTENGGLAVRVTAVPEDGRATEAVRRLLAEALGIAPSRLVLLHGALSRDKVFRVTI